MTHVIEVPFHIGDFLSGTMGMDGTEIGAYWMLIIAHYQAGEKGLADDDKKLAQIARVEPRVWKRIRPTLAEKFDSYDGVWKHKKVLAVLKNITNKSTDARAKALKRWDGGNAAALPRHCPEDANQEPITNKEKKNKKEDAKPSKPDDHDNPYWFDGPVIKIRKKDYFEMLGVYGGTDEQFFAWLKNRDEWLENQAPHIRKNWFMSSWAAIRKLSDTA
jgi:uncharacterized protein YdaU (DUF1376 family)